MNQVSKPPATVSIRYMRLSDLEQVQAIDRISFSLPWPSNAFHYELMENKNSLPMIAEFDQSNENKLVVATIILWIVMDEAHIATLAVHPDYRRLGIAQKLLATALLEAIQKGAHQATLEVRSGNQEAQSLYHRFGFKIVGRRPRYYKDNYEDAVIMTRNDMGQQYRDWLQITAQISTARG
ncbi:MAG: ribosomal protein S18-alanine N-acetyltransferase [Anaerolineales bacterium]|nr:ribosomal protein S18-alanine N-acetyltransferase [Anaerolineales bacterium]